MNTNWNHWQNYTSGLASPQNYIDWAFLYTISASLQRRVWLSASHMPTFPNMYCVFVGKPGVGKGLAIGAILSCLKAWKQTDYLIRDDVAAKEHFKMAATTTAEADQGEAEKNELQSKGKTVDVVPPLLIPVAADATTYEALVLAVAESIRRIQYIDEEGKLKTYGHSSICFCLPELASLLRKRTDDTVNYLLGLYDCPYDYEYKTITRGKDRVRKACLNIVAGTTPSFMSNILDDKLIDQGFSSRTFFIFAHKNRKNHFFIPELTEEQKHSQQVILQHIRKLTTLYGQIKISPETRQFLEHWFDTEACDSSKRVNKSVQLDPYYARKNIHVMKLAIAKHFSESLDMFIPIETFKWAIAHLAEEEKRMHFALTMEFDNQEARVAKRVMELLASGKKNFIELHAETYAMIDQNGLEKAIGFLIVTDQIRLVSKQEDEEHDCYAIKKGD